MLYDDNLLRSPKRNVLSEVTNQVSPTANLKLLTAVALQCTTYQRKEKSLQILCDRFLEIYPLDNNCVNVEIQLDFTAQRLGVEKRRIYDIINILEALQCATHLRKNTYMWHGSSKLNHFLARLKSQGETLNGKKKELIVPKRRSLGNLAQRFLMMFLVKPPNTLINLDMAVDVLIQHPQMNRNTSSNEFNKADRQLKSRVRRLYDIANVLSSIGLIQKVSNTSMKKPVFRYVDPKYVTIKKTPLPSTLLTPDSINATPNSIVYPTSNRSKRKLEFSSASIPHSPPQYINHTPPLTPKSDKWGQMVEIASMEFNLLNNQN